MGDVTGEKSILKSPIQQPVAQIFYNVLGKVGGIFFTVCAFIILKFGCFAAMQALTRTVFAFARDGLVPFSGIWVRIMPRIGIPIFSVWITVLCCIGINLIGLGSYPAIAGVYNVCAIALDWSLCIPIFCKIIWAEFVPGPWHLGQFSIFANAYACLWTVFVSIIFVMPINWPVTADTVRYSFSFSSVC
jgi:amino acid transporter